jgi:hypothetical protein
MHKLCEDLEERFEQKISKIQKTVKDNSKVQVTKLWKLMML